MGHQNKMKPDLRGLTPSYPAWQGEFAVLHHFFGANLCQQIQDLTPKDPEKSLWNTCEWCEIHSSHIFTVIIVYWLYIDVLASNLQGYHMLPRSVRAPSGT